MSDRTTRVVLDLTDKELLALGYMTAGGLALATERVDARALLPAMRSIFAKIHDSNERAARAMLESTESARR